MSKAKRGRRRQSSAMPDSPSSKTSPHILNHLIYGLLDLPRFIRIMLVFIISLCVVLAIFPLVDEIYIRFLLTEETVNIPALFSAAVGMIMYIWGWILLVGTTGIRQVVKPSLGWYLLIAFVAILIDIVLIIQGLMLIQ